MKEGRANTGPSDRLRVVSVCVFVSLHMNRIFVAEIIHSVHVPRPHKLNEDENKIKPSFRL